MTSVLRHLSAGSFVLFAAVVPRSSEAPDGSSGPSPPLILCASDEECGGRTPICDPLRGCVACQGDTHCDEGQRCVDRACEAQVTCSEDADYEGTRWGEPRALDRRRPHVHEATSGIQYGQRLTTAAP